LDANLAKAMLSINAVNGFFVGNDRSELYGSQSNDIIEDLSGKTKTNNSGGIQAGISNGNDIFFNVSFKPVSTIMKPQESINNKGEKIILNPQGRHDPCVLPRAVPIVEAMTAIVLLDHFLLNKTNKLK
jgi:chorismate synthase